MGGLPSPSKVLGKLLGPAKKFRQTFQLVNDVDKLLPFGQKPSTPASTSLISEPDEIPTPATLLSPELPSSLNLRPPPTASDPAIAQARLREKRRAAATSGLRTILTSGAGLRTAASTAPRTLIGNRKILPAFSSSSFNTLLGA